MVAKKDPEARRRPNFVPPPAGPKLVLRKDAPVKVPKVPAHTNKALWARVWSDPSAQVWTAGDHGALSRWCHLSEVFQIVETAADAAKVSQEMRQLEAALGLGAVARGKLGWVVEEDPAPATVPGGLPAGVVDSAARFRQRAKG